MVNKLVKEMLVKKVMAKELKVKEKVINQKKETIHLQRRKMTKIQRKIQRNLNNDALSNEWLTE